MMTNVLANAIANDGRNREQRRHEKRHPDCELPELLTKTQVAKFLQCSSRQVELLTLRGKICPPVYLSDRSPRWWKADLVASLGGGAGQPTRDAVSER